MSSNVGLTLALCFFLCFKRTVTGYAGQGQPINPESACAKIPCYQEIPDECCPFPFNYQGAFFGAQYNLVSALGYWKTLFAQTACLPRCQPIIFGERFRQCVTTNNLASTFEDLFSGNVCNGACLYGNKAVWQPLTNATGPCNALNTQPTQFACPSGCRDLLALVPEDCRGIAASVKYQGYGDFLTNAFQACNLKVSVVCAEAGYLGCELIANADGTGSAAGTVVAQQGKWMAIYTAIGGVIAAVAAPWGWLGTCICVWTALEYVFYILQRIRVIRSNAMQAPMYDSISVTELQSRFMQLLENNIFDLQAFVESWFRGTPFDSIKRDNVMDLIAYGMYTARPDQLTPEQQQLVDSFLDDIERVSGHTFASGRNPDARFMAHLWEPLRVWHKPLTVHLLLEGLSLAAWRYLAKAGFQRQRHGYFDYYMLLPSASNTLKGAGKPIVFLHGVGFGLLPYVPFIKAMAAACPTSPLVVIEAHHVSQRLSPDGARSVDDMADCVRDVVRQLGAPSACLVGHSYGTFVVSRLLHQSPGLVDSAVMLDPVCMLICYPQLLESFVYADMEPENLRSVNGIMKTLRLLVSRDAIIAEAFCRKFCWRALMAWPDDLPDKALVAVGGSDDLLPGPLIVKAMEVAGKGDKVTYKSLAAHGGILLDRKWQNQVLAKISDFTKP